MYARHGLRLLDFWRRANQERDTLEVPRVLLDLVRMRHAAWLASLAARREADGDPLDQRELREVVVLPGLDLLAPPRGIWSSFAGRAPDAALRPALDEILASEGLARWLDDPVLAPSSGAGAAGLAGALTRARVRAERELSAGAVPLDPALVMNEVASRMPRRWPRFLLALFAGGGCLALALHLASGRAPRPERPHRMPAIAAPARPARALERLVARVEPGRHHYATLVLERGSRRVRHALVRLDPLDPRAPAISEREATRALVALAQGDGEPGPEPLSPATGLDWYQATTVCRAISEALAPAPLQVRLPRPAEWPALLEARRIRALEPRTRDWLMDGPATLGLPQVDTVDLRAADPAPPERRLRTGAAPDLGFLIVIAGH